MRCWSVSVPLVLSCLTSLAVAQAPDDPLAPLDFLVGAWRIPPGDSALVRNPELAGVDIIRFDRTVGEKAIRIREMVPRSHPDSAELDGLLFWDPAQERLRFVAVAGKRDGQGRLFMGELAPQADGTVERSYDVYYRTPADMPGEEAGGSRRRYREIWRRLGVNRIEHTLEWWWEGRWQSYARGSYTLVRSP